MPELGTVIVERLAALQAQKADLMNRILRVDVAIEELTFLRKQMDGSTPVGADPAGVAQSPSPVYDQSVPPSGVVLSPKTHTPVVSPVDQLKASRKK